MDDGSYTSKKNRTYRFSTHSLTLEDQPAYQDLSRLVQVLNNNFSGLMAATIQKLIIYSAFGGSQNRLSVLSI